MLNRVVMTIVVLSALSGVALAASRPDARTMNCNQVQDMIKAQKAVVLTTGQHTYDRFVDNSRHCSMGEFAQLKTVNTRDTPQCIVHSCTMSPLTPFGDW